MKENQQNLPPEVSSLIRERYITSLKEKQRLLAITLESERIRNDSLQFRIKELDQIPDYPDKYREIVKLKRLLERSDDTIVTITQELRALSKEISEKTNQQNTPD